MEGEARHMNCDINNLKATELRLGLPGTDMPEKATPSTTRGSKRGFMEGIEECRSSSEAVGCRPEAAPPAKVQVVGWPPVRSYRRNLQVRRAEAEAEAAGIYVKVSMDGAPYLRKIDLKVYKGYMDLREALEDMFKGFSLGDLLEKEGCKGSHEHALAYEDRDGDWMMVGDVPWEMFISCCKRLRIMRGNEAIGLASNS